MYVDDGNDNRVPARFNELLTHVDRSAGRDASVPVIVSDMTRLVRSWAAFDAIRQRVQNGALELTSARQLTLRTDDLLAIAELSAFAYDGPREPLDGTDRAALIDGYVDGWLIPWLRYCGAAAGELDRVRDDVGARLRSVAFRWDRPDDRDWLIGAVREVAELHEPAALPVLVRAAALLGVRNSVLEDLHIADPPVIEQYDWRVITQAAAWFLSAFDEADVGTPPEQDPFAGISEQRPAAAAALAVLASLDAGDAGSFSMPDKHTPGSLTADRVVPLTPEGFEVMSAMDPEIGQHSADVYARVIAEKLAFAVPSLKHISRNPAKLLRVLDALLVHGVRVVTANVDIHDGRVVRRRDLADYNSTDLSWAGLGDMSAAPRKVGRNEPCPCGSGKKYKQCCGR